MFSPHVHVHGITPSGNQNISTLNSYDVTTKATARISAAERAKIIPANIAAGVTILGVAGTATLEEEAYAELLNETWGT